MTLRGIALGLAIICTASVCAPQASAQQLTTPLSPAAFVQAKKVARGAFEGLTPQRSFRLTQAGLNQVLTKPWLTTALRNRLTASNQAGILRGVVITKVRRVGSLELSTLWLFYDGSLFEVLVAETYGSDGGSIHPDLDFKICPWFVCMIEGQQCDCDATNIIADKNDECPEVNPNCCADFLCDETDTDFNLDTPADMSTLFG